MPSGKLTAGVATFGLVGLVLWASDLDLARAPRIELSLQAAEDSARTVLAGADTELGPNWIPLFSVSGSPAMTRRFAWESGTATDFEGLEGRFLFDPALEVRFVNFEVAPEERAETFYVNLPAGGHEPRVSRTLPEGRPGESLSEEEARALAMNALSTRAAIQTDAVREISAEETSRPARTDWVFTFRHAEGYSLSEGEGRTEVEISGGEVSKVQSYVHVPESWEREWRSGLSRRMLMTIPLAGILGLAALGGLIIAVVKWSRGSLYVRPLRVLLIIMAALLLVSGANEWPNTMGGFSTQMSLGNQTGAALLGLGLGLAVMAMGVGLFAALGHTWAGAFRSTIARPALVGLAAGCAYVGFIGVLHSVGRDAPPAVPSLSAAIAFFPWLSVASGTLIGFLATTAAGLFTLTALDRLGTNRWSWTRIPVLLLIGLTTAPNTQGTPVWLWIASGAGIAGGVWGLSLLCRRLGWAIVPGAMAAPVLLGVLENGLQAPHPGSSFGTALAVVGVGAALLIWTRSLEDPIPITSPPSRGDAGPDTIPGPTIENAN
jgi:hypothetical protein